AAREFPEPVVRPDVAVQARVAVDSRDDLVRGGFRRDTIHSRFTRRAIGTSRAVLSVCPVDPGSAIGAILSVADHDGFEFVACADLDHLAASRTFGSRCVAHVYHGALSDASALPLFTLRPRC